jgi:hypothetical protein
VCSCVVLSFIKLNSLVSLVSFRFPQCLESRLQAENSSSSLEQIRHVIVQDYTCVLMVSVTDGGNVMNALLATFHVVLE